MTENVDKKAENNPEVVQKAARRQFTAEYKRRIALEAESCREPGGIQRGARTAWLAQGARRLRCVRLFSYRPSRFSKAYGTEKGTAEKERLPSFRLASCFDCISTPS